VILVSRALPPVSGQEPGQDFDLDVDQWRSSVTDQSTSLSRVAIHILIFIIVAGNVSLMFLPRDMGPKPTNK
jgi:hypothetical protein